MSGTTVALFEWVDENGEVEDFLALEMGRAGHLAIMQFFEFKDAIFSVHFGEFAEKLLLDYQELTKSPSKEVRTHK